MTNASSRDMSNASSDVPANVEDAAGSTKESLKIDVNEVGTKLKDLLHEGNVRRIIVKREKDTIAEFPVTAAVVGIIIAPVLAAIGAIAAIVTNCTIEVESTERRRAPVNINSRRAEKAASTARPRSTRSAASASR